MRIKSLIYSMTKALECTVVELVYKFNEKSTVNVLKGESIIYMDANTDHITPLALRVRSKFHVAWPIM